MFEGQAVRGTFGTATLTALCRHRVTLQGANTQTYSAASWPKLQLEMQLHGGWHPLRSVVEHLEHGVPLPLSDLGGLLSEAKAHYPFKRKSNLGPGPLKGKNKQTDHWDCDCSKKGGFTVCKCDDLTGATKGKIVKIPLSYKKWYNKIYRAWLAKKAAKAAASKKAGKSKKFAKKAGAPKFVAGKKVA